MPTDSERRGGHSPMSSSSVYTAVGRPPFTCDAHVLKPVHSRTHQFQRCLKDDDRATLHRTTWSDDGTSHWRQVSVNINTFTFTSRLQSYVKYCNQHFCIIPFTYLNNHTSKLYQIFAAWWVVVTWSYWLAISLARPADQWTFLQSSSLELTAENRSHSDSLLLLSLVFLFSVAHCLGPMTLTLRPYGVIQICLLERQIASRQCIDVVYCYRYSAVWVVSIGLC